MEPLRESQFEALCLKLNVIFLLEPRRIMYYYHLINHASHFLSLFSTFFSAVIYYACIPQPLRYLFFIYIFSIFLKISQNSIASSTYIYIYIYLQIVVNIIYMNHCCLCGMVQWTQQVAINVSKVEGTNSIIQCGAWEKRNRSSSRINIIHWGVRQNQLK